uniref:F-box/LRR-repeat protein 15-like leucin rich repeat domain-containing protein n=1 Tax=Romanomermis culicivorax TaxID=13658 RepID=A0A915JIW0_ROMCU
MIVTKVFSHEMVKPLHDICLDFVYRHLIELFNSHHRSLTLTNLPYFIREALLYRVIDHDLLTEPQIYPLVTYHLIGHALQRLRVYGSSQLDDNFLYQLGQNCQNLKEVSLVRCLNVTDRGLTELLANQTKLESLELRWLIIGGESLSITAARGSLKSLRSLILKGCSNITPVHVFKLVSANRNIIKLNLFGLRRLSDEYCCKMLSFLGNNLLKLNLSECLIISDSVLEHLGAFCPNLTHLKMIECMNVTENGFKCLMNGCSKLARIDISFCVRYGENALSIEVLDQLPSTLTSLSLSGIRVNFDQSRLCVALRRLDRLTRLNLSGFGSVNDDFLFQLLSGNFGAKIHSLDLSGNYDRLTDAGLSHVAEFCTNLRTLSCALLNNVNGRSLRPMFVDKKRASNFETVIFTVCVRLDYEFLAIIAENCNKLQKIDFSGVPCFDDYILTRLAENCGENLRHVYVKAPVGVTDGSVIRLAENCPNLRSLSLSGNGQVTDASILKLAERCFNVRELYLSGCMMVSPAATQFLKDQCSGRLSVYHVAPSPSASAVVLARNLDTGQYVRIS